MDKYINKMLQLFLVVLGIFLVANGQTVSTVPGNEKPKSFKCDEIFLHDISGSLCTCLDPQEILCYFIGTARLNEIMQALIQHGYNETNGLQLFFKFYYEETKFPLDMNDLINFRRLSKLAIIVDFRDIPMPIKLLYNQSTIETLSGLEILHLGIPLDTDLTDMLKPLKSVKTLQLTNTMFLGSKLVETFETISLNPKIEKLQVRNFQYFSSANYIDSINLTTFLNGNFTHLRTLDLSRNYVKFIGAWGKGLFSTAPNLAYLDLSNNLLVEVENTPFIIEALMHPFIEVLNFSNQMSPFGNEDEAKSGYTERTMDSNVSDWPAFDESHVPLRCIENITGGNISALFGERSSHFVCSLMRNCFRPSWSSISCDYIPDVYELLDFSCFYWIKFPIGKNLRELNFENFDLDPTEPFDGSAHYNICFQDNNVMTIHLNGNYKWTHFGLMTTNYLTGTVQVHGLKKLQYLYLQHSNVNICFFPYMKITFPNLVYLNLSENQWVTAEPKVSICRDMGLHKLQFLDMSSMKTPWLSISTTLLEIVTDCNSLRVFRLAGQGLDSELSMSLKNVPELELIDLQRNKITVLNKLFMRELGIIFQKQNLKIDLSHNPITCACDIGTLQFFKWIENNKESIADFSDLKCKSTEPAEDIMYFNAIHYSTIRNNCIHMDIIVSVIATLSVVIIIAIIVVMYRARFRLQYKLVKTCRFLSRHCKRGNVHNEDMEAKPNYEYDAFVSYSSEDRFWVHDVLMKTLEDTYGFKLVIHYRDFQLGENVHRAIDDSMTKSREFIIVFTDNFLESDWCITEMEAAYRESLHRNSQVAIIVLGDVPHEINHPTARLLLDRYNYLQWKVTEGSSAQDTSRQKLFWSKLVHHLYGGKQTNCICCLPIGPRALGYREVRDFTDETRNNGKESNRQDASVSVDNPPLSSSSYSYSYSLDDD